MELAQHVLQLGQPVGQVGGVVAHHRGGQLTGVPGPLGQDAHGVELLVGGVSTEGVDGLAQAAPPGSDQLRELFDGRSRGTVGELGPHGCGHEVVEQLHVGGIGHRLEQRGDLCLAAVLEVAHQPAGRGAVVGRELPDVAQQPLDEHVGVAHDPERRGQALQLGPQAVAPAVGQHGRQRLEVGAQASGADPGLVHALGVVVEAHHVVVADDLTDRMTHRGGDHGGHVGVGADLGHHQVGRHQRPRAEGPDDLGGGVRGAGTGGHEGVAHGLHEVGGSGLGQLHLDLTEAGGDVAVVDDGDLVVVDLEQLGAVGVDQAEPLAVAADHGDRHQRRAAHPAGDERGQLGRHHVTGVVDVELAT